MEAKELRIGNLVLIPSHTDKSKPLIPCIEKRVKGVTMFGELDFTEPTYPESHLVHYKRCAGIPLTEEWLLKLGFEDWGEVIANDHEKYQRFVLHNAIDGTSNFEVHIIKSNYGNMPHTEIVYSIDNDERQIIHSTEFVHNLQNSFYLSSGTELIIKE